MTERSEGRKVDGRRRKNRERRKEKGRYVRKKERPTGSCFCPESTGRESPVSGPLCMQGGRLCHWI
jgi:hypothetical protein